MDRKYDRDRLGRLLQNQDCGRSPRHNDVYLEGDELGGQRREAIGSPFRRSELKDDVLAFHKTDVMQPLPESLNETGSLRAERGCKITYPWDEGGCTERVTPESLRNPLVLGVRSTVPRVARACLEP